MRGGNVATKTIEPRAGVLALRHRLPNAPPSFVGRTESVKRLHTLIERAPVSLVWGLGGFGKTSLVRHTLHAHFTAQTARTISLGVRPDDPADQLAIELTCALAELQGRERVDWSGLMVRGDAFLAALIDHAESLGAWVVLEDLHNANPDVVRGLLGALSRYARRTRWIVTGRERFEGHELDAQMLRLDAMPETELRLLAAECGSSLAEAAIDRAVRTSAGSPWRLRQCLAGDDPGSTTFAHDVLEGLPPEVIPFLEALTVIAPPLRIETLTAVAALPSTEALSALERRGLVERSPAGLRLHDLARSLLLPCVEARARSQEVAAALARTDDPQALLEALRLLLGLGAIDELGALLDERGERLIAGGHAARLWPLLAATTHARLARARLRCAVELGDQGVLAGIELPADATPFDHLLIAYSLYLRGRLADAVPHADRVREFGAAAKAFSPDAARLEHIAGILQTACLGEVGRVGEAIVTLEQLATPDVAARALRDAHLARWYIHDGDVARARALLDGLIGVELDPDAPLAIQLRAELVNDHALLGSMRTLQQTLEALGLARPIGAVDLFANRRATLAEVVRDVFSGRLGKVAPTLRAISQLMSQTSYLRTFVFAIEAERKFYGGDLAELEITIERMRNEARLCDHVPNYAWSMQLAVRTAVLRGQPTIALPAADERLPSTRYFDVTLALALEHHACLHGLSSPPRPTIPAGNAHFAVLAARIDGTRALVEGDGDGARRHAEVAVGIARENGLGCLELDCVLLLADALLVLEAWDELGALVAKAEKAAAAVPSERFVRELRLHSLAHARKLPPSLLEELALGKDVAPAAARRARALLGEDAALDAVDRVVLDVLRRRSEKAAIHVASGKTPARHTLGWGLDVGRKSVWLPGGRSIELRSRALLFRILLTLVRRGGTATKEQLVRDAWGYPTYHSIRDDKRLQVAIRKLRLLVEEDPSRARRVLTTEDGYRLGEEEPLRVVEDAGQ